MQLKPISDPGQRMAAASAAGPSGAFASQLAGAMARPGDVSMTETEARHAAEQLVATTFIQPLLQQMRRDPLKSDLMHGGLAEDTFAAQLDTQLADRIVQRTHWPLVDRIVQSVMRGAGRAEASLPEIRA